MLHRVRRAVVVDRYSLPIIPKDLSIAFNIPIQRMEKYFEANMTSYNERGVMPLSLAKAIVAFYAPAKIKEFADVWDTLVSPKERTAQRAMPWMVSKKVEEWAAIFDNYASPYKLHVSDGTVLEYLVGIKEGKEEGPVGDTTGEGVVEGNDQSGESDLDTALTPGSDIIEQMRKYTPVDWSEPEAHPFEEEARQAGLEHKAKIQAFDLESHDILKRYEPSSLSTGEREILVDLCLRLNFERVQLAGRLQAMESRFRAAQEHADSMRRRVRELGETNSELQSQLEKQLKAPKPSIALATTPVEAKPEDFESVKRHIRHVPELVSILDDMASSFPRKGYAM